MKRQLIIITIALLSVVGVRAQLIDTKAAVSISRDSIMIGDTLSLYVDVEHDMATVLSIPSFEEGKLTDLLEIAYGPVVDTLFEDGRKQSLRLKYVITSFESGGYKIDSFPLLSGASEPYDTLFARGEDLLKVGTYKIDTTQDKPLFIKGTLNAPYSWDEFIADIVHNWHWFSAIFVAIILTVLMVIYIRRRRLRREINSQPKPPHIVAMAELARIQKLELWQQGKIKEYFSEVADTLRTYIDGRYGVNAMEMTSAETLSSLKEFEINKRLVTSLKSLLDLSDLAKFAKAVPTPEECQEVYDDAVNFVEQTKVEEIEEQEVTTQSQN